MKPSNIIQIVVGILIFIAALVGVIYGITRPTEGDNGIYRVCTLGSQINYDSTVCQNPESLLWERERFPLRVSTGANQADSDLASAISIINFQVGCEVFIFDGSIPIEQADVSINPYGTMDVELEAFGGSTSHFLDAEWNLRARVEILGVSNPNMRQRVFVHELGHVLGLMHDDFEASIMFPTQAQTRNIQFIQFTSGDRKLLRELYCE